MTKETKQTETINQDFESTLRAQHKFFMVHLHRIEVAQKSSTDYFWHAVKDVYSAKQINAMKREFAELSRKQMTPIKKEYNKKVAKVQRAAGKNLTGLATSVEYIENGKYECVNEFNQAFRNLFEVCTPSPNVDTAFKAFLGAQAYIYQLYANIYNVEYCLDMNKKYIKNNEKNKIIMEK